MRKLKELRNKKRISQLQLANEIGVSRSTEAMRESNSSQPDNALLGKLDDYFGVSVDYLLGRKTKKDESYSLPIDKAVVGTRLQALRKKKKISQQSLADHVGVNQTAISQWDRGVTLPSTDMLHALSELYGVSVDYLLGISDDPGYKNSSTQEEHDRTKKSTLKVFDENDNPIVFDDETLTMIDSLRTNPGMKMLFSVAKTATPEDIMRAVKIIEALKDESK